MTNFASTSTSITGTADGDIIFGLDNASSGQTTVNGGDGNDVIFGDHPATVVDQIQFNNSIANAFSIDASGLWSTFENPDVGDSTIPYTTVLGTGAGNLDFFSVTVGAGETITIDADWGNSSAGGNTFDGFVRLLDASGAVVSTDDDSTATDGGLGSTLDLNGATSRDPLLTATVATAGTYYIEFGRFFNGSTPQALVIGDTYTLNISVTGHAATGVPQGGNDDLNGGIGDDVIYGMAGNDNIVGGDDNDRIYAGVGDDTIFGGTGDGDDYVEGGAGADSYVLGTGTDTFLGGTGRDVLQIDNPDRLSSGDVLDGGNDGSVDLIIVVDGTDGEIFDFTSVSLTGFEAFDFNGSTGTTTAIFTAAQFEELSTGVSANSGLGVFNRGPGAEMVVNVQMDSSTALDLSSLVFFEWSAADTLRIIGDGDNETITGSDAIDTIETGAGNDTIIIKNDQLIDNIDGGGDVDTLDLSDITGAGQGVVINTDTFNSGTNEFTGLGGTRSITGIENVVGTQLGDFVRFGELAANLIDGQGGDDTIQGGFGEDTIFGGDGDDLIQVLNNEFIDDTDGGGETDTLDFSGMDNLFTGADVDFAGAFITTTQAVGGGASVTGIEIYLDNASANTIRVNDLGMEIEGRGGDDTIYGGAGFDTLDGGANDDLFYFSAGQSIDNIDGGSGTDGFDATAATENMRVDLDDGTHEYDNNGQERNFLGMEHVSTGSGDDEIIGNALGNVLEAGAGRDTLTGGDGDDTLEGGNGDDTLEGGENNDVLRGDAGADNLKGENGNDVLSGGDDNDVLNAGAGIDVLFGGAGNDLLFGGAGFDKLFGGAGFDRLFGGADNDIANGGADNDIINTGAGNDLVFAQGGNDLVFLQAGNDNAFGGIGNDKIFGGIGNDEINLGDGNDEAFGGAGVDVITGAGGNDVMSGGGDGDRFVFAANQGADRITDFSTGDTIDISAFGVADGGASDQDWRDATTSVVSSGGGANVTIAWDGGGSVIIENIGIASLTDSDFVF